MGRLLQAYLVPHPPIIVPAVGKGREQEAQPTYDAFRQMANEVKALAPQRVVVLTPHGCRHDGVVTVSTGDSLSGDLQSFGAMGVGLRFVNDTAGVMSFLKAAREAGLPVRGEPLFGGLDHGAFIPLTFLHEAGCDFSVMHVVTGMPMMQGEDEIGATLRRAMEETAGDWVLIISGDLSHRLSESGPYGFAERGLRFEEEVERVIAGGDLARLDVFDGRWCNDAAQCGIGPLRIARGILGEDVLAPDIFSHEWPFGVGYMVARLKEWAS